MAEADPFVQERDAADSSAQAEAPQRRLQDSGQPGALARGCTEGLTRVCSHRARRSAATVRTLSLFFPKISLSQ